MNCSLGCMKCLVFVFNIVYAIVGVALLSMGTIFFTQELDSNLDAETNVVAGETNDAIRALTNGALLFLITGVLAILLAALGCCGAIKESPLLLRVCAIVLVVLSLGQVIISGMSFVASKNEDTQLQAKKKVSDNLQKYSVNSKYQAVQRFLEEKYHCCGSDGYFDYKTLDPEVDIPKSCCLDFAQVCDTANPQFLKKQGCGDAVVEKIIFLYKTVGAISIILFILQIIGAVGVYFLAVTIINAKRRGTFT